MTILYDMIYIYIYMFIEIDHISHNKLFQVCRLYIYMAAKLFEGFFDIDVAAVRDISVVFDL